MEAPAQTLRDTALELRASGISILPIVADGSKSPATGSWRYYQTTIADEQTIIGWFPEALERGLAVIGGAVSGGLEVLDFDLPGLYDQWLDVVKQAGLLNLVESLPLEATPKGGRHLFWRCSVYAGNTKLAKRAKDDGTPETVIETRGEGGYAIVSPSPASCHPLGKPYVMLRGAIARTPEIDPAARETLLSLAQSFNEYIAPERQYNDASQATTAPKDSTIIRPGDDFNSRADWQDILEPHGWRLLYFQGQKGLWQRPGKDGTGISGTTNYAGGKYGEDRLYVFSSNAYPFESERSYSKFSAYALLEHNGDFKAAARALAEKGYGTPLVPFVDMQHYYAPNMNGNGNGHSAEPLPNLQAEDDAQHEAAIIQFKQKSTWPDALEPIAFYGLAGDIVRAIVPQTEADPAAVLLSFLVGVGNIIGRGAYALVGPDRHGVNLFVTIVGDTAKGRKGTSWGHVRELLLTLEPKWSERIQSGGLSSGEGVIWAVRDKIEKTVPARDGKNHVIQGEFTTELLDPGIDDKRLLILESEFAGTLSVMARDGNTLSPILRNAWDGVDLSALTKNSPARSTEPHISIVAHITKDELLARMAESESSNGFANRFLWVCARRSQYLPEGGDPPVYGDAVARLGDVVKYAPALGVLRRDEQAKKAWEIEYRKLSDGYPGLLGMVTARAEAQVLRLSALYAALDLSHHIKVEHLAAALAVWKYCESSAKYIFGDATGDQIADRILDELRRGEGLTRTDIAKIFSRHAAAARIDIALDTLSALKKAARTTVKTGGRPVEIWRAV